MEMVGQVCMEINTLMYLRRCYPVCTVCLAYFVMYGRVWRRSRKHVDARAIHISFRRCRYLVRPAERQQSKIDWLQLV